MTNILISGALGKMGKKVFDASLLNEDACPVCGVDVLCNREVKDFPIYNSFEMVTQTIDVVIDFSSPANLDNLLNFAKKSGAKLVLCTTGYTKEDLDKINLWSKEIAIFRSANMSLGVNVLIDLVKKATKSLYGFDIEIIEKHHNQKKDAPSGTALMLADGVKEVISNSTYVYGREGIVGKRTKEEIGLHAVRGGNIVGEHQVIFAGEDETITLTHQATDRGVFAQGAVKAAIFMKDKTSGLYNMNDIIKE